MKNVEKRQTVTVHFHAEVMEQKMNARRLTRN